jgi:transcriptional regulator
MADNKGETKLKLEGLVEETKKMIEKSKDTPKLAHHTSVKCPTRVTGGKNFKTIVSKLLKISKIFEIRFWIPLI